MHKLRKTAQPFFGIIISLRSHHYYAKQSTKSVFKSATGLMLSN